MTLTRALTATQRAVLEALVRLCPDCGQEADERALADDARLEHRMTVLSVRALARRGLVAVERDGPARFVRPTWAGRDCWRALQADAGGEGARAV